MGYIKQNRGLFYEGSDTKQSPNKTKQNTVLLENSPPTHQLDPTVLNMLSCVPSVQEILNWSFSHGDCFASKALSRFDCEGFAKTGFIFSVRSQMGRWMEGTVRSLCLEQGQDRISRTFEFT